MSGLFDYKIAEQLANSAPPVDSLIMAAVMRADSSNKTRLQAVFPELVAETDAREQAPYGRLDSD